MSVYFVDRSKNPAINELVYNTINGRQDFEDPSIVIEQIRAAILDGLYKPGERVLEADLVTKFKVSRSSVVIWSPGHGPVDRCSNPCLGKIFLLRQRLTIFRLKRLL
jgi:hypothetical protein